MNKNSKIWTTTDTGMKYHAFPVKGGGALCRKNIKARMLAESSDFFRSLDYIREMFTASDVCTSCEAKVRTHEAFLDSEHAIALAMNEEFDAQATIRRRTCICPVRTDYHTTECAAFQVAHIATDTDTEENDNVTIKDGPLTERQIHILNHLRAGKRHEEIAKAWATVPGGDGEPRTISVGVVKQECQIITAKFGASTVMQATSIWATAQAYRAVADNLDKHSRAHPQEDGVAEDHVNHVLMQLAELYRDRADRLTPR